MPAVLTAALFSARCRAVCLLAVFLCAAFPQSAAACKFKERPFAEKMAAAPLIAIGHIETVENGLVVLRVQQSIKGLAEGQETIEFEAGQSSCDFQFAAGQRWLYMGQGYPSDTMLLEDEYARQLEDNIAFVQAEFNVPAVRQSLAEGGTLSNICAPWDGAAMSLKLNSGEAAQIYSGFGSLGETPRSFSLDEQTRRDGGRVILCPEEGKPCQSRAGLIYLHVAPSGEIEGRLEIKEGEHTRIKLFRVRREDKERQFCG